ncbi:cytochrome P450 [Sphingobium sp.]|uniref:cytochrome P450 n=1 Tax=Sphingobium sp. TaxID=1912891 RepID=UPI003BB547C5
MPLFPRYENGTPSHVPSDRVVDFDIYNPPGVARDFHQSWKDLQSRSPADLIWTPCNGGHWISTRGRQIKEIFADYDKFSSSNNLVPKPGGRGLPPLNLDPPAHRDYRILLNNSLSLKEVSKSQTRIRELARELIEPFLTRGEANFTHEYAEVFPIRIFAVLMGLPMSDTPRLKHLTDLLTRPGPGTDRRAIIFELLDYMQPLVEQARKAPGDDLMSHLATAQIDGKVLELLNAAELCLQVMLAGLDTVVNLLGFVMHFLATHEDERRILAENPGKIPGAVGEIMRRFPVVVTGRCVAHDMLYDGVELKQGEMIILPSMLHGLDDEEHSDPMAFDLERRSRAHSTFGNGPHKCPGSHLGLLELKITLEEWLALIPEFTIAKDADLVFEGGVVGTLKGLKLVWPSSGSRP